MIATKLNFQNVCGEVFQVDDKMFERLDKLEEHPKFYERKLTQINTEDSVIDCWCYFMTNFRQELLSKEFIEDYDSLALGELGLEYLVRSKRPDVLQRSIAESVKMTTFVSQS